MKSLEVSAKRFDSNHRPFQCSVLQASNFKFPHSLKTKEISQFPLNPHRTFFLVFVYFIFSLFWNALIKLTFKSTHFKPIFHFYSHFYTHWKLMVPYIDLRGEGGKKTPCNVTDFSSDLLSHQTFWNLIPETNKILGNSHNKAITILRALFSCKSIYKDTRLFLKHFAKSYFSRTYLEYKIL